MKRLLWIVLVLVAGMCYSCGHKQELITITESHVETTAEAVIVDPEVITVPDVCYVHICGEINQPGVYEMAAGDRIYQVVERAGGYTAEAAADYLNLAQVVSDGMKLVVPDRQELSSADGDVYGAAVAAGEDEAAAKINLNTASKEALMSLRGIGEARALDIIRYREEQGPFAAIEDIMKIPGIKNAAFEKIKDDITV